MIQTETIMPFIIFAWLPVFWTKSRLLLVFTCIVFLWKLFILTFWRAASSLRLAHWLYYAYAMYHSRDCNMTTWDSLSARDREISLQNIQTYIDIHTYIHTYMTYICTYVHTWTIHDLGPFFIACWTPASRLRRSASVWIIDRFSSGKINSKNKQSGTGA